MRTANPMNSFDSPITWRNGARTYWGYFQVPSDVHGAVVGAYREVFSAPPWEERWPERRVAQKILREIGVPTIPACASDTSFLTVIDGGTPASIGGFSWGAVVDVEAIPGRLLSAHPVPGTDLDDFKHALAKLGADRVVYTDEIGVLPRFRGGILPVAQLCYPTTVLGSRYELPGLCWSSESSRIIPILKYYHYEAIARVGDIVVLHSPAAGVVATKRALEEIFVASGFPAEPEYGNTLAASGRDAQERGQAIASGLRAHTYGGLADVPPETFSAVVDAYIEVFRQPPWCEEWPAERVAEKLRRELSNGDSFLNVLWEDDRAAGFCWGTVIGRDHVAARVQASHPVPSLGDLDAVLARVEDRVIFVDEIAKLPACRGGIEIIARLVLPVALAVVRERTGVLCWSGKGSRIIPILTNYLEFETLAEVGDITFYHLPVERSLAVVDRMIRDFGSVMEP